MRKTLLLLSVLCALFSCEQSGEKFVPQSVGAINSISVVIDPELWKGPVGDEIRKHFAAPVDGLPQEEPLFSLNHIPPKVFTDFTRSSRNILWVSNRNSEPVKISDDVYAKPQKFVSVKGSNNEELIEKINKNAQQIINTFKQNDISETQNRFKKSLNKETTLKEKLGISLSMPSIYKVVKQENNFIWIERQIPKGTMNIIAYEMPLNSIPSDSLAKVEAIIKMRDSIGEKYIPGREPETMWMITEKAYAPYVFDAKIAGLSAIETKGMWEVKNFYMAGPFVNYIITDTLNNRLLVLEGFSFAPSENKRDYMFELEAIIKTVRIQKKT